MANYQPADALRHSAAHALVALARAREQGRGAELLPMLEHVAAVLANHIGALDIEPTHYTDGAAVTTHVALNAATGDVFSMVWHPDPSHAENQPRVAHACVQLSNGEQRKLIITARGVIDSVPVDP